MCNKAVDDFLPALKIFPEWFVTNKVITKLLTALFADDDILFFNEDSVNVTFSSDKMGILSIDLNNINLDDDKFDDDDPEAIVQVRLMSWYNKRKHCKTSKNDISKVLMPLMASNKMMG